MKIRTWTLVWTAVSAMALWACASEPTATGSGNNAGVGVNGGGMTGGAAVGGVMNGGAAVGGGASGAAAGANVVGDAGEGFE